MKVTLFLRYDHEALQNLFAQLGKSGKDSQNGKKILSEIKREIQMHSQISSEIFYSALAATPSDRAAALVSSAQKKHQTMDHLIQDLNRMSPTDPEFERKLELLMEEVGRHIEMEEGELFHEARKNFPEHRLEELGLEMQDRREILKSMAIS